MFKLPKDILTHHIFSNLSVKDFQNILVTCKYFSQFGNKEIIWKNIAEKYVDELFKYKPDQKDWKWLCLVSQHKNVENNFYGDYIVENGVKIKHGICISFENKTVKSGEFKFNEAEGFSKIWEEKFHYSGYMVRNLKHGKGIFKFNGTIYEGDFSLNKYCGNGIIKFKSGNIYKGEFFNNYRHGYGEIYLKPDQIYKGNWRDNHRHGYGEYYWKSGDYYKGEWRNDDRHGYAETYTINGIKHIGNYLNDKRHGKGCLIWKNGDKYEGKWENGARKGKGIFTSINDDIIEQIWNEPKDIRYSNYIPDKYPKN